MGLGIAVVFGLIAATVVATIGTKLIHKKPRISPRGKAVLVTGCSSGIGRSIATHLARKGFVVFATVRRQQDADSLAGEGIDKLVPVCPLDLADHEQVVAAAKYVQAECERRGCNGLWGVVNNAGGGWLCPLEVIDTGRFRREFETRVFGPLDLLSALMPSIRQAHGRVLWTVVAGLMPLPFVGSIHVPEWATQCMAATLDMDLHPWGIPSIRIGCGMIQTAAPDRSYKDLEALIAGWPESPSKLWREKMEHVKDELQTMDDTRTPAIEVAKAAFDALTTPDPRPMYRVGKMATLSHMMEFFPFTVVKKILLRKWGL